MATYTLQRALDKLQTVEKKIKKHIRELNSVVTTTIGNKPPAGYATFKDYEDGAKALWQSLNDLIAYRNKLKAKIIETNATTKIKVLGEEMTIAEAIDRRHFIEYKKEIVDELKNLFNIVNSKFEKQTAFFREKLDNHLETLYGKEGKHRVEDSKELLKVYYEANEPKFLDPLDIKKLIATLEEEISTFEHEIKFALTEANVKTVIEIEE